MLVPMRGPMMLNDVTYLTCPLLGVGRQQGDGPPAVSQHRAAGRGTIMLAVWCSSRTRHDHI